MITSPGHQIGLREMTAWSESRFHPSDSIFFYVATNYKEWIYTVVRDEINSIPFRFDAAATLHDIKLVFIILKRVIIRNQ